MTRKSKRDAWRLNVAGNINTVHEKHQTQKEGPCCFDELVIGEWFHIERMDDDTWWFRIGQRAACIGIDASGKIKWLRWQDGPLQDIEKGV